MNAIKAIFLSLMGASVVVNDVIKDGLSLWVSQKAVEMIIYYECGDRSYYNKLLARPTVPAWRTTQSGVTIGIGFDTGYNSKAEIRKATTGILPESSIKALESVSGMKGKNAYYNGLPKVKNTVFVTYENAEKIFFRDSLVSLN